MEGCLVPFKGEIFLVESIINILDKMGIIGLLAAMVIQGLSIPFPGALITIVNGYLMNPSLPEMFAIALAMSFAYSISSCIPYAIGFKLQVKVNRGPFKKKFSRAQHLFSRFGEWSIAVARPAGAGMFISFVAGMSRIKLWRYLLFTLAGTYPWSFALLFLGRTYKGNADRVFNLFQTYSAYIFAGLLVVALACAGIYLYWYEIFSTD